MNFAGYFECKIVERAHIRSKTFKVSIPSIMSYSEKGQTGQDEVQKETGASRVVNNNVKVSDTMTTTGYVLALNHTDYYERLRGNIFKKTMDGTDGITEPKGGGEPGDPRFSDHDHDIKQPMSLFNFTFEDLNNVYVEADTKAYGFFINGAQDTTRFAIVRIEGVVPLQKDDPIPYVE